MTLVNYAAIGLFNGYLDKWYMDSWKIWIAICVIFSYAGIFSLAIQRHRTGEKSFTSAGKSIYSNLSQNDHAILINPQFLKTSNGSS